MKKLISHIIDRTSCRKIPACVLTAALAVTLGVIHGPASAEDSPVYAALGDSYSAGNSTTGSFGECRRSDHAYGPLLAHRLGQQNDFIHAACNGADTSDLVTDQLDAIGPGTRLVTLTIGGNDGEIFKMEIFGCVINPVAAACDKAVRASTKYIATSLPKKLDNAYAKIADKLGPGAVVLVGGYPETFYKDEPASLDCGLVSPSRYARGQVNTVARAMNREVWQAVQRANGKHPQRWEFVPVDFTGHELCSGDSWLTGIEGLTRDIVGVWHPSDEGHQHYADRFESAYRSIM